MRTRHRKPSESKNVRKKGRRKKHPSTTLRLEQPSASVMLPGVRKLRVRKIKINVAQKKTGKSNGLRAKKAVVTT
jgi:hypothetical protein